MKEAHVKIIRLITLAVWIFFSIGLQIFESIFQWDNFANDFYSYYVGSKLLWMDKNPYFISNDFLSIVQFENLHFLFGTGYSYPPLLAFAFYPFTLLEANTAARVWQLFNCSLYAVFIYIVLTANKHLSLKQYLLLAIVLISFIPVVGSIVVGQVNIIVLLLLSAYFLSKNETVRAGGLVLASFIKVYPILFIIKDFVYKNFRFIGKFVFILFFLILLLGFMSGFDVLLYYFSVVLPTLNTSFDPYYTNQSITGVLSRLLQIDTNSFLLSQIYFSQLIFFITSSCLGGLILLTIKFSNRNTIVNLLWIGVISLVAGKNSFWNFAPCILLTIYFIQIFGNLSKMQKLLFFFSIFLSNFFLLVTLMYNIVFITELRKSNLLSMSINSVGFMYLSIQIGLLLSLLRKKKYTGF